MFDSMQVERGNVHRREDVREKIPQKQALRARSDWGRSGKRNTKSTPFPVQTFLKILGGTLDFPPPVA